MVNYFDVLIEKKDDGYYCSFKDPKGKKFCGGPFMFYDEAYSEARGYLWENFRISDLGIRVVCEGVTEVGGFKIVEVEDKYYFSAKVKENKSFYKVGPFFKRESAERNAKNLLLVRHGLRDDLVKSV